MPTSRERIRAKEQDAVAQEAMGMDAVAQEAVAPQPRTGGVARILAKVVLALAFLGVCNAAVNYLLQPYGSVSQVEWTDYRQLHKLDTLFIGSSYVQQGIVPAQLDDTCGTASFCLGTPQQRLEETFVGLRTAYEDHHIKNLVLGVSPSAFTDSAPPSANTAYLQAWREGASVGEAASVAAEMLLRQNGWSVEESINCLFPWKNYHVTLRPANIANNLHNKWNKVNLVQAANSIEERWRYLGQGHGASDYRLDLNWAAACPFNEMIGTDLDKIDGMIAPARERTLREMCQYCQQHGIRMMVVMVPMPTYNVLDDESACFGILDAIGDVLDDYDVPLYDFNCLKRSYFTPDPALYSDSTHLNVEGSRLFTDVFARFFGDWLAGKDVEGYFVSRSEALAAEDGVSVLFAEGASVGDAVQVECRAVAGPGVEVQYRLCTYVGSNLQESRWADPYEDEASWQPVTNWTNSNVLEYTPEHSGVVELRAQARAVGSSLPFDRFRDVSVVY